MSNKQQITIRGQGQQVEGKSHTEKISNLLKENKPATKLDQWKAEVQKNGNQKGR